MDDWGGIIGLGMIIGAIYIIIKYIIPLLLGLAAIILAVFAGIEIIIGLFFAIRNFIVSEVFLELLKIKKYRIVFIMKLLMEIILLMFMKNVQGKAIF